MSLTDPDIGQGPSSEKSVGLINGKFSADMLLHILSKQCREGIALIVGLQV